MFTTTPQIITDKLLSLSDPKNMFAAQNILPLVYKKAASAKVVSALNSVSAKLTTADLLAMNKSLSINHESYTQVASTWLSQNGLK